MNNRILSGIVAAAFVAGILPLTMLQPQGSLIAGLSAGILMPLTSTYHVFLLIATGFAATRLFPESDVKMALLFLLALFVSGAVGLQQYGYGFARTGVLFFAAILAFGFVLRYLTKKNELLVTSILVAGSYRLGEIYLSNPPEVASPSYFLIGTVVATALLLGTGITLGWTFRHTPPAKPEEEAKE